eukprot:746998-Hanusia_phi.AAC.1
MDNSGSQESLLQFPASLGQYKPLTFNLGRDRAMIAAVPMWGTSDMPDSDDDKLDWMVNSALTAAREARSLTSPYGYQRELDSWAPPAYSQSPPLSFSLPAGCVGGCKRLLPAAVKIQHRVQPPSKEEEQIYRMSSSFKRLQRIDAGHYKILSSRILSLEKLLRDFAAQQVKHSSDVALVKTRKILAAQASIRKAKRALDAVKELRSFTWTSNSPE